MNSFYNDKTGKWEEAEPIPYEPTCWLEKYFPKFFEWLVFDLGITWFDK